MEDGPHHRPRRRPRASHAQAIELKKTILYEYGKSQLDQKQHADAHRTLTELAALDIRYRNTAPFRGQARARLTQDLYNEGIRRYREEDLEGAIALWRVVLAYDPDHADARKNIEQAERALRELERRHEEAK
jgi:tetratricopeptide (TPR) repeat protein